MFDRLPLECGTEAITMPTPDRELVESETSEINPFDDLDLQSTFFEQYLLQDTRSSSLATGTPGTLDAWQRLAASLRAANKAAGYVRLVCVDSPADRVSTDELQSVQPHEGSLAAQGTAFSVIERAVSCSSAGTDEIDHALFRSDSGLRSVLESDLVWIAAQTESAKDSRTAASQLLTLIQKLRSEATSAPADAPVLIVSSMRRSTHEVALPFISGLSDSQIHVPLWIDHGAGHACRIQALTGSNDLLPTLWEYLTGEAANAENSEPNPKTPNDQTAVNLSSRPLSLVGTCQHHNPLPDRLLRVQGDTWDALRTQQYFLVRSDGRVSPSDSAGSLSCEDQQNLRRLYLKPDDVWNVNDAIVAYSAIADQMERMAEENEHAERLRNDERRA